MKKTLLFFASVILITNYVNAQCSVVQVPLAQRVSAATLILEGRITQTRSFWNDSHRNIFTANHVEIYKVFKGTLPANGIDIITEGGKVGLQMEKLSPGFTLTTSETGIFFLYENNLSGLSPEGISGELFRPFADAQGFIKYQKDGSASDRFNKYNRTNNDLYNLLTGMIQHGFSPIGSLPMSVGPGSFLPAVAPTITTFSPATIAAGTYAVLTINGTNFGATQSGSTVEFANADDGGATFIQLPTIATVSWSNTQIQVQMVTDPGVPGTGTFQVVTAGGTAASPSSLTVKYAEMNLLNTGVIYQTDMINQTAGGYDWEKFTGFATNAPAVASFQRAFDTWKCGTTVNWTINASTTAVNVASSDGTNVIRFDIGGELPVGVLGRCSSYWSGCSGGTVWYVNELDIVFDDAANWEYGPTNPTGAEYDFESVALHELGHGHQFNHSILNTDVMNYAIANATTNRIPTANNIAAGTDIMIRSAIANACGPSPMVPFIGVVANGGPTVSICNGSNTVIGGASTAGHTYSWSPATGLSSTTISNPTANPAVTTLYTVVETVTATGCVGADTVTVLVGTFTANGGPSSSICAGNSTTIGIASVAGHTYSWAPATGLSSTTASNPTANPVTTTIYTLTETVTASGCTGVDTVTVTIGSFTASGGPGATICAGSSATIGAANVAGHTYSWLPVTGLSSSTASNPTASPTTTTVYTLTETITASGCLGTDTVTVTVPVLASNAGASAVTCAGVGVPIGTTSVAGHTYAWLPATGLSSSTISNPMASPAVTTIYTLTETITATGCFSQDTVTVTVGTFNADFYAVPLTGLAPLTVAFHDTSLVASSWDWDANNDGTSDYFIQNPLHTYPVPGLYTVKLKINGSCSTKIRTNYILVQGAGVNDPNSPESNTMIFPNPFSEAAVVRVKTNVINPSSPLVFRLYDMLGQTIREENLLHAKDQQEFLIRRDDLPTALYFYELRNGENLIGKGKLVVY